MAQVNARGHGQAVTGRARKYSVKRVENGLKMYDIVNRNETAKKNKCKKWCDCEAIISDNTRKNNHSHVWALRHYGQPPPAAEYHTLEQTRP